MITVPKIDEMEWHQKEFDWTGKAFYFIPIFNLFNKPLGLNSKINSIYNLARQAGYKIKGDMILVEWAAFKGKIMIEIEGQDKLDANVLNYDLETTADTHVFNAEPGKLGGAINRLIETVASRRAMKPRGVYYSWGPTSANGKLKCVLFAVS